MNIVPRWAPTTPPYDENGNYSRAPLGYGAYDTWNPLAAAKEPDIDNNTTRNGVNTFLEFKIIEGLKLKITGGANIENMYNKSYYNSKTWEGKLVGGKVGYATIDNALSSYYQNSNILSYEKNFGKNHIDITAVAEQQYSRYESSGLIASKFTVDQTGANDLGGAEQINSKSSSVTERNINSYLGRINIIYLLGCSILTPLVMFSVACTKLEEQPISSVTPANFGNSVLQIEALYTGSLNYLWDYWAAYGYAHFVFENDDQINGGSLDIGSGHADFLWNAHYSALLNINLALGLVKKGNIKQESQETLDLLAAEGKFLRAHNYFMLVRMFGGVPLITEDTPDPIKNPMPRASIAEVYDLIVSDLTYAAEKLPDSWEDAPGRPTSGAAKSILAKVYLTMATYPLNEPLNYQKAADMALQVIESGTYSLVDSVVDVFKLENKYGPEMIWSYNSTEDDVATDPEIWTTEIYLDGGWGDCAIDTTFERRWPEQRRKDAYLLTELDGVPYTDFPEQTPFCKKFFFYISADDFNGMMSTMNWPIIRYADVLLIYAEAANMASGSATAPQEAVDAINQVIERANGYVDNPLHPLATRAITKADFDKMVIQERSWELMLENGDRWFDICRKRILDDPNVTYRDEDRLNFSMDDYLFPLPETDLRINNLLEQNPGYATP